MQCFIILDKSKKCRTKEVKRKGAEPEVSNVPLSAHNCEKATAAVTVGPEVVSVRTGAGGSRNYARKKDKESVKYATKKFSGKGSVQNQYNGQLRIY